jgi:hypothetical protein
MKSVILNKTEERFPFYITGNIILSGSVSQKSYIYVSISH